MTNRTINLIFKKIYLCKKSVRMFKNRRMLLMENSKRINTKKIIKFI